MRRRVPAVEREEPHRRYRGHEGACHACTVARDRGRRIGVARNRTQVALEHRQVATARPIDVERLWCVVCVSPFLRLYTGRRYSVQTCHFGWRSERLAGTIQVEREAALAIAPALIQREVEPSVVHADFEKRAADVEFVVEPLHRFDRGRHGRMQPTANVGALDLHVLVKPPLPLGPMRRARARKRTRLRTYGYDRKHK